MKTCEQCGKAVEDILEYVEHILRECGRAQGTGTENGPEIAQECWYKDCRN